MVLAFLYGRTQRVRLTAIKLRAAHRNVILEARSLR